MKPTKEQVEAYKAMAAQAPQAMKNVIKNHLELNCLKFKGNEDKLDRCIKHLYETVCEMLGGRKAAKNGRLSGQVPSDTCFRICMDYFNDEVWKAEDEEEQKKKDDFEKMMKKWNGKSIKMNDIEIYVPRTYEEVDAHAKALHQCLIYADYIKKVIEKKLLLVFVSKNGKPNATAEIKRDGTIGQFYADERSKNIFPSEVVKKIMNEWIEMYKPNLKRGRKAKEAA